MHDTQECGAGDIAGEASNDLRFQVNDEGISKTLIHEGDALVIGRDIGALSEMREDLDLRREKIEGIAGFSLGQAM
jgi:hypothetical protein